MGLSTVSLGATAPAISSSSSTPSSVARIGEPTSRAQGVFERFMASTASAISSLKNKVISFASDIRASLSAPATNLSGATRPVLFHPVSINSLREMHASIVKGDQTWLFRVPANLTEAKAFEVALSQGDTSSFDTVSSHTLTRHLNLELGQFKMTSASFKTLSDLKDEWLSAPEKDKRAIAKEAVASYVESLPDTADKKKATVMLQIYASFANLAPEGNLTSFNRGSFDICVVPNFMHLEHVHALEGHNQRQTSGTQIFDMLMGGVSPLTSIKGAVNKG